MMSVNNFEFSYSNTIEKMNMRLLDATISIFIMQNGGQYVAYSKDYIGDNIYYIVDRNYKFHMYALNNPIKSLSERPLFGDILLFGSFNSYILYLNTIGSQEKRDYIRNKILSVLKHQHSLIDKALISNDKRFLINNVVTIPPEIMNPEYINIYFRAYIIYNRRYLYNTISIDDIESLINKYNEVGHNVIDYFLDNNIGEENGINDRVWYNVCNFVKKNLGNFHTNKEISNELKQYINSLNSNTDKILRLIEILN